VKFHSIESLIIVVPRSVWNGRVNVIMPTKTTRIRRGLLVGKKDRLEIERWSCDSCRTEFENCEDAERHEDTCRIIQSRAAVVERSRLIEGHGTYPIMETASSGDFHSISSTTNVNNNHGTIGVNREQWDVNEAAIPLVIHVAKPSTSTIQETRDEDDEMADMSPLRHDLRRQMASNKNVIKEQSHHNRALPRKTRAAPGYIELDDDEVPPSIRSGQFMASVVQQQIASISNMQYRLPRDKHFESTANFSSLSGHDREEVIGIQRRLPVQSSSPREIANTFSINRIDNAYSTNRYTSEHETLSPVRTKRQERRNEQPTNTNEYQDTPIAIERKQPQQNLPITTHRGDSQQDHNSYQNREEMEPESSEMKWVCDCCRKAQFGSYVDAFRHEIQCRKQMILSHQQMELETMVHSEPEHELRLSTNRRALRQEQIKRQVYEKSRSLCSTVSDTRNNMTAISSMSGSYGVAGATAGLNGKPSTSSATEATKWLCSICKEVCFDHYLDACRHEKDCARLRRGRYRPQLLQQVEE
jgi:hypothetical protein